MIDDIRLLNAAGLNDRRISELLGIHRRVVQSRRVASGIPAISRDWPKPVPLTDRFWSHVSPEPNSGCWLWEGATNQHGYGIVKRDGTRGNMQATHASLLLSGRPVPAGLCACHRCDNPPCVNPDHLFIAPQASNVADMVAKGRSCRGEKHRSAKLTEVMVRDIRDEAASGRRGVQACIAERLGISNQHVSEIVRGIVWAGSTSDGSAK